MYYSNRNVVLNMIFNNVECYQLIEDYLNGGRINNSVLIECLNLETNEGMQITLNNDSGLVLAYFIRIADGSDKIVFKRTLNVDEVYFGSETGFAMCLVNITLNFNYEVGVDKYNRDMRIAKVDDWRLSDYGSAELIYK